MYSTFSWADLADALAKAQAGHASGLGDFADSYWGILPDGSHGPISDRYFMIGAIEQRYTSGVQQYLDAGDNSWGMFDHFSFNSGYLELNYGLWPIHADDVFPGPFHVPASAQTILEVATTYDPATPYRDAKRLAAQLGNVRLLTMIGDGYTFGGNSPCIDDAVIAHIETLTLPASGMTCQQMVPFVPPPPRRHSTKHSREPRKPASGARSSLGKPPGSGPPAVRAARPLLSTEREENCRFPRLHCNRPDGGLMEREALHARASLPEALSDSIAQLEEALEILRRAQSRTTDDVESHSMMFWSYDELKRALELADNGLLPLRTLADSEAKPSTPRGAAPEERSDRSSA